MFLREEQIPPRDQVIDALLFGVLPAGLATAVTFAIGTALAWLVFGKWLRANWRALVPGLAVVALAAGLAASPLLNAWTAEKIEAAQARGDADAANMLTETYKFQAPFPWVPDAKWWHWGWYAIGVALAVELLARVPGVGVGVGHLLRGVAAGVIAAAVVPPDWQEPANRWWLPLAAGLIGGQWVLWDAVSRRNPGGSVAAAGVVLAAGAAAIALHDGSMRFTDLNSYLLTALVVLAVAGWVTRSDVGSAGAVALPVVGTSLLLVRGVAYDPPVPSGCYWLVGLAPLTLVVFLLPPVTRFGTWRLATVVKVLLVAVPVGVAVYRCVTEAPLVFGQEQW